MFRALVIAVTLTGMSLCQHRCMTGCASGTGTDEPAAVAACACCGHRHDRPGDDRPLRPCAPAGDCGCQGVCGGALVDEAYPFDGLRQAWSAAAIPLAGRRDAPTTPGGRAVGHESGPRAAGGRALRILFSSLLT